MQAAFDCKPHEMMKNFAKYGTQLHMQLAAKREFMI